MSIFSQIYEYFFGSSYYNNYSTSQVLFLSDKSSVYRVVDKTNKTDYTVKYCVIKGIEYTNEVEILKTLKDVQGVQKYVYHHEFWGRLQIVYNYVEGVDLFTVLVTKKLLKPISDDYFKQLLFTMKTVHNYGIIHRDLKPENVIVYKNKLTIIDWGLATLYTSEKASLNDSCGSIYSSAPEIITGESYVGPEVDIWSLGVIWYIIHSGEYPYDITHGRQEKNTSSSEKIIHYCKEIAEKIKLMSPDYSKVDEYVSNILKLIFVKKEQRIGINKILTLLGN